jgi:hypothetical protein
MVAIARRASRIAAGEARQVVGHQGDVCVRAELFS